MMAERYDMIHPPVFKNGITATPRAIPNLQECPGLSVSLTCIWLPFGATDTLVNAYLNPYIRVAVTHVDVLQSVSELI